MVVEGVVGRSERVPPQGGGRGSEGQKCGHIVGKGGNSGEPMGGLRVVVGGGFVWGLRRDRGGG